MTNIGYTIDISYDFLIEIELLGNYKGYNHGYSPTKNATYSIEKYKTINAYDVYGNKIVDVNNKVYNMCMDQQIFESKILFVFDFECGLEKLRKKLFFIKDKSKSNFVQDEDDSNTEDEFNIYSIGTRFNIYKKKENVNINFSGFQNIYTDDGRLFIKFFHNNGIKEGLYKVYTGYENGYKIVVMDFLNDIQITKPIKRLKLEGE